MISFFQSPEFILKNIQCFVFFVFLNEFMCDFFAFCHFFEWGIKFWGKKIYKCLYKLQKLRKILLTCNVPEWTRAHSSEATLNNESRNLSIFVCCDWLLDRYAPIHWLPFLAWAGPPRPQAGMHVVEMWEEVRKQSGRRWRRTRKVVGVADLRKLWMEDARPNTKRVQWVSSSSQRRCRFPL